VNKYAARRDRSELSRPISTLSCFVFHGDVQRLTIVGVRFSHFLVPFLLLCLFSLPMIEPNVVMAQKVCFSHSTGVCGCLYAVGMYSRIRGFILS